MNTTDAARITEVAEVVAREAELSELIIDYHRLHHGSPDTFEGSARSVLRQQRGTLDELSDNDIAAAVIRARNDLAARDELTVRVVDGRQLSPALTDAMITSLVRMTRSEPTRYPPRISVIDLNTRVAAAWNPREHRYWGFAELGWAGDWRVTRTAYAQQADHRARQIGEVPVTYLDPATGSLKTQFLVPVVVCPRGDDQWRWLDTGWDLRDPGPVPTDPLTRPPLTGLRYEVREYRPPLPVGGPQYYCYMPHWFSLAWCATLDLAQLIADAATTWNNNAPQEPSAPVAAQIWGPSSKTRRPLATITRAPGDLQPPMPAPPSPTARPESAPATRLPSRNYHSYRSGEPVARVPKFELRVHTGAASSAWETVCWSLGADTAAGIAYDLGVGQPGARWATAEIWGPQRASTPGADLPLRTLWQRFPRPAAPGDDQA